MATVRRLMIISLIFLCIFLTACLEVKQTININKDGSGDARLEVAVMAAELIPKLKSEMPKEWSIIEEKEKEGKHVIVFGRKFKEISELNDNEATYSFSSEKKGFLKKSYTLEIKQLKSSEMPFPYEISVKVPGSIDETDGTKFSSSEVKWNLQGFRRGKELSVKSSGFAMPDFASLKESFNKVFNFMFYREAIVFLRDNNLWVMDSDGKNQKQLTKVGVGSFRSFSVSIDGKNLAFINNATQYNGDIYLLSMGSDIVKPLTDTSDCSFPVISPSGTEVAFVKTDERYTAAEAQKIISEAYNPDYIKDYIKEGGTKKTGIYVIDIKTGQQKRIVGELPTQKYLGNPTVWQDGGLFWSPDGQKLHFQRSYSEVWGEAAASYLVTVVDGHTEHLGTHGGIDSFANDKILYEGEGQLSLYDITTKKTNELGGGWNGDLSNDGGKLIYVAQSRKKVGENWAIATNLMLSDMRLKSNKSLLTSDGDEGFWTPTLSLTGNKLGFTKSSTGSQSSVWSINIDGSDLRKLAENASTQKWTSIPRITFISPSLLKIIILALIALTGLLLLAGMALIARKAIKAVIAKIPKIPKRKTIPKENFCTQCGKETSPTASFCTTCGQRLR